MEKSLNTEHECIDAIVESLERPPTTTSLNLEREKSQNKCKQDPSQGERAAGSRDGAKTSSCAGYKALITEQSDLTIPRVFRGGAG